MLLSSTRTASALGRTLAPAVSNIPHRLLHVGTRAQQRAQPTAEHKDEPAQSAHAEKAPAEQRLGKAVGPDAAPSLRHLSPLLNDLLAPTPFRRMADSMLQMQREMDSLMSAFGFPADPWAATDVFDRALAPLTDRSRLPRAALLPRVVVDEDDKDYTLTAEVPGFDRSTIKVTLDEHGVLTLRGSTQEETTEPAAAASDAAQPAEEAKPAAVAPSLRSRKYASFVRSLSLPEDAAAEGITATTEHGLLTVRIPKREQPAQRLREIPVA